jgi:hypothetical protein
MIRRGIISMFLAFHVTALMVSAIPNPKELKLSEGVRESPDDALSARVRPVLDSSAEFLDSFANRAWQVTGLVRPLAMRYVGPLGLVQNWAMFGNPPRGSEYLRFRHYSTPAQGNSRTPLTVTTELVFPIAPETSVQLFRAYWEGHRDKAISNALIAYFRVRLDRKTAGQPGPPPDGAPDVARTIGPVADFFADRFVRTSLPVGHRLVRSEAWYGLAPSRPRGDVPLYPESRARAVERYYRGIPSETAAESAEQPVDTLEHEADIVWMLIHIQKP